MEITMDIEGGPDRWAEALEAVIRQNRRDIRRGLVPDLYSTTVKGVVYRREKNTEKWKTARQVMRDGHGDCEDLAAWRVAWLREHGEPLARPRMVKTGRRTWHAIVQRQDGSSEDPTKILKRREAMEGKKMTLGQIPVPIAETEEDNYKKLRGFIRRIPGGWEAQIDLPLHMRQILGGEEEETSVLVNWDGAKGTGLTKADAVHDAAVNARIKATPKLREQAEYQRQLLGELLSTPEGIEELGALFEEAEELGFLPALLAAIPGAIQALPGVLQSLPGVLQQVPQLLQAVPATLKQLFQALPGMPGFAAPATTAAAPAAPGIPGLPGLPGLAQLFAPAGTAAAAPAALPGLAQLFAPKSPFTSTATSPLTALASLLPKLSGYEREEAEDLGFVPSGESLVWEGAEVGQIPWQTLFSLLAPAAGVPMPPPGVPFLPGFPSLPIPGMPQAPAGWPFIPEPTMMSLATVEQLSKLAKTPKGKKTWEKIKEKGKGLLKKLKLWGLVEEL